MKWLFLVTFTLLAVGVFSAAFNNEEDVPLKELMEDDNEGGDDTETEQGGARFVREVSEDEKDDGLAAMAKSSLTENDEFDENDENDGYDENEYGENDNTQNDEPEGNFAEMDEIEAPIDNKAAFDEEEDLTNENPEQ